VTGRYILQPEIFDLLGKQGKGAGGEIQLTDSMIALAGVPGQTFWADRFDGKIYDTGSKIGFLTANVAYALARPELRAEFAAEIKALLD
jgi:UTP--glucose-1-phosphate uridylyltransferase